MLPKITAYVKRFGGKTKWIYFLIKNDDLYPKNNNIWDKFSVDTKKEFFFLLKYLFRFFYFF